MIIAICGDCGWLGGPPDLEMKNGLSDEELAELGPLMLGNKDASHLVCPNCAKGHIFYKNLTGGEVPKPSFLDGALAVTVPSVSTPVAPVQQEPVLEAVAATPAPEPKIDDMRPPLESEYIPPPEVDSRGRALAPGNAPETGKGHITSLFRCMCDDCGNEFDSKVERSTRCGKCTRKITGARR